METAMTVIGGLASLAGGILSCPFAEMIDDFQEWSINDGLAKARKMIGRYGSKAEKATDDKTFTDNDYLTGSLCGLFAAQRNHRFRPSIKL